MQQWHPDYTAEYARRCEVFDRMQRDEHARRLGMEAYKLNPVMWIEDWCITYNPRNVNPIPKTLPFLLFPRQVEFIDFLMACLRDKECGLVEKSRDIGATWLSAAFSIWLWLFVPGAAIGWGSRKEQLVDRIGDPDSIFEKMRMLIGYLPPWMMPLNWDRRFHQPSMKIINPDTGAIIAGESGDQIGRGGRKMIYFKDEAAHYERPELIEAALGDNTDVQIDISSVNGTNNVFYRRRMAGEVWNPGSKIAPGKTRVFIFDWRDHPLKTQAWYDLRRHKAEDEGLLHIFAQEVDRDYAGSIDRIIIPALWVRAAIDAHIKLGFTDDGLNVAGQDVADGGADKNAFVRIKGVVVRFADHWGGEAGDAARRAIPYCLEQGIQELYYDSVGVGTGFKVEINNMRERGALPKRLRVFPWNGGAEVLDPTEHIIPGDPESPTNEDQYTNLKAQGWFRLRSRFYKTYRSVMHGDKYNSGELISLDSKLPHLHELMMQLSQAVHKQGMKGKTMVDKKPDGALSPNLADALVTATNPTREASIFDSM